ncbi:hypothetical protein H2198_002700 [Neophaeococcomyces mojaviensis]|uniref:Uncharacterized protein n=1 Tax=Neophaeococcomyces mojaviensis TaxID=3383035 RepID=A0ACC3ADF1_9EURO|nr:hypothetical protein H2198_002700 [Knufia sp. JES_112]
MTSHARRALGDKDANTHLKIQSLKHTASSKIVKMTANAPESKHLPDSNLHSSSPKAGTKRKIDEVEDAERVEHDEQNDSQRTQFWDESQSEADNEDASMSTFQRSYDTARTSFIDGQHAVEPQFELQQDEMSQRTLDKLNAVPMPQNTSQLPPNRPILLNEMSAGSVGLSTFLNLEDQTSTQGSDGLLTIGVDDKAEDRDAQPLEKNKDDLRDAQKEEPSGKPPPASTIAAIIRAQKLPSILEDAKTRLQLAMYKVQTRQTHKPFSRLKCESVSWPSKLSSPRLVTPRKLTTPAQEPSSGATITAASYKEIQAYPSDSAEAGIAAMLARPHGPYAPSHNSHTDIQHFPSSPPISRSNSAESVDRSLPKATLQSGDKSVGEIEQQAQLSSPPISDGGRAPSVDSNVQQIGKGEAATGLLQLMSGGHEVCHV